MTSIFILYKLEYIFIYIKDSLLAQTVKSLPAKWETRVRFLGQEDRLEKEMATHSSILEWKIPRMEEPGGAIVHRVTKSRTQLRLFINIYIYKLKYIIYK